MAASRIGRKRTVARVAASLIIIVCLYDRVVLAQDDDYFDDIGPASNAVLDDEAGSQQPALRVGVTSTVAPGNDTSCIKIGCNDGVMLPLWCPVRNLSLGDKVARAVIYIGGLVFLFLGVAIISDRFMASIEVITSKEKEVVIQRPDGETTVVYVRVWNETVSNLTLMALGSSAPEIMLSVIEIVGRRFKAGDLGPGTIVGSAAFNMFIIIAICVWVIPSTEVKKIKHLRVFALTTLWALFAYIWLYLIVTVITPGVVEIWEAVLTLVFFPLTVGSAWIADRRLLFYKYLGKRYRQHHGVVIQSEGTDTNLGDRASDGAIHADHDKVEAAIDNRIAGLGQSHDELDELREFERHRQDYVQLLRELKKKRPNAQLDELEAEANYEMMSRGPKSRAVYRLLATRKMGGGNIHMPKKFGPARIAPDDASRRASVIDNVIKVSFEQAHTTCLENCGSVQVRVLVDPPYPDGIISVKYWTESGSAEAGSDFNAVEGVLDFAPGETQHTISIAVVDDDVFEEDEYFFVKLGEPRIDGKTCVPLAQHVIASLREDSASRAAVRSPTSNDGGVNVASSPQGDEVELRVAQPRELMQITSRSSSISSSAMLKVELVEPMFATVTILDDDHCGIYSFGEATVECVESVGTLALPINRGSGARGRIVVPYRIDEGSAKRGRHFDAPLQGELVFEDNQVDGALSLPLIDEEKYEKDVTFTVTLLEPLRDGIDVPSLSNGADSHAAWLKRELSVDEQRIADLGRPRLGSLTTVEVHVRESREFKSTVDKLLKKSASSFMVGTSSWLEQFKEALSVEGGDGNDDDGEGEDEKGGGDAKSQPSAADYVLHFLSLFWKLLFAFVPPTDYLDGWLAFVVSLLMIGFLTAVIGDLASHLGCYIGLADTVTAISFVALGTSLPDTFASKIAAQQDKYADASIGNVNGSNAVNVFLGIGIAWTAAAVYHWPKPFDVDPGSLGFSVFLFCTFAVVTALTLFIRRLALGGELGGPMYVKAATAIFFTLLWVAYVAVSTMVAYDVVRPPF